MFPHQQLRSFVKRKFPSDLNFVCCFFQSYSATAIEKPEHKSQVHPKARFSGSPLDLNARHVALCSVSASYTYQPCKYNQISGWRTMWRNQKRVHIHLKCRGRFCFITVNEHEIACLAQDKQWCQRSYDPSGARNAGL